MSNLRVLITDDSVVYRSQIRSALSAFPWVEVVGTASNGKTALERLRLESSSIDLLILDLEMPEMNGLETLKEIVSRKLSVKTLVFSAVSKKGAEITLEALKWGANDFVTKPAAQITPGTTNTSPAEKIRDLLEPKLRGLFPERFEIPTNRSDRIQYPRLDLNAFEVGIVVVASSTGGPAALEKMFLQITGPLSFPVVIAQHMPPIFTASLAERIERITGIVAKEGVSGEVLKNNQIYFAPGDFHLTLAGSPGLCQVRLDQGPQQNSVRPSADPLFVSAAKVFGERCLGVVLTGMGNDGRDGACAIKQAGGAVVIQNRESCVVYGMPRAVEESGAFDQIMSVDRIAALMLGQRKSRV